MLGQRTDAIRSTIAWQQEKGGVEVPIVFTVYSGTVWSTSKQHGGSLSSCSPDRRKWLPYFDLAKLRPITAY